VDVHDAFMASAVRRARRARHRTSPNPKVGCVIVADGQIVGAGVTRPHPGAHAEVVALRAAGARARGADMYVTLEPCCHHGRTPPCTDAVVKAGIARVFVGVTDPNPLVGGRGVEQLRAAGIVVENGVLGEACADAHAPFFRFITAGRPWVMLKAAVTLDGRIATADGDSKWITGAKARADVHRLRASVDAVMVGAATALADDPRLTVRHVKGPDPRAVLADSTLRVPPTGQLFRPGTIVLHGPHAPADRRAAVAASGATPIEVALGDGGLDPAAMLSALAAEQVVSLMIEGGGRLHGAFLGADFVDEACIYIAPRFIGRGRPVVDLPSTPTISAGWQLVEPSVLRLGDDLRMRGRIARPEEAACLPD
jgi:diaminohydroxyphosphoribosylaminopyrimidine deaminase/5-amino-6-(5-phosphoribosylamino)uracil reductase